MSTQWSSPPNSSPRYTMASLLMHAALAQASPQVQTFDAIISLPRTTLASSPTHALSPTLPLELLLLIRSQLVSVVTDRLIASSDEALVRYEDSLRLLLCDDCLDWHEDVYGPSVWQWQRFSGRCWCNSVLVGGSDEEDIPDAECFRDPLHWLEDHLSKSPIVTHRYADIPASSKELSIWTLVRDILREYHCDVVQDISHKPIFTPSFRWPWSEPKPLNDQVMIVPATGLDQSAWPDPCSLDDTGHDRRCHLVMLYRVERDLGLPLFSSVDFMTTPSLALPWSGQFTFSCQSLRYQTSNTPTIVSRPRPRRRKQVQSSSDSDLLSRACRLINEYPLARLGDFISSISMLLLCAPLTILTMLAHIICYYARPGALRVF